MRIAGALIVFATATFLFKRAAGTLNPTKLNMISVIYYYILGFNLLGGTLIYIGFREHYMIQKIRTESVIDTTYYILAYTVLMFPAVLLFMKYFFSRVNGNRMEEYRAKRVAYDKNPAGTQILVIILMTLSVFAIVYVTNTIGYVPMIEALKGEADMGILAQAANRRFRGNVYIKNILMVWMPPYLSYYAYIKIHSTKLRSWKILFGVLLAMSVFVVTYDLSKAPILNYILGLYLLDVNLGRIRNRKRFLGLALGGIVIILLYYVVMLEVENSLFSIYTGPVGRIIFSQIATLFLHVQLFPTYHPYLQGASFSRWFQFLIPGAEGLRSGRVVMAAYNPEGIRANTAGVMNTLFVGEAYANFGIAGVLAAPIIFGIVIGIAAYILPGLKKDSTSVLLYVEMTLIFITMVEGGFVDIFYSVTFILAVGLTMVFKLVAELTP